MNKSEERGAVSDAVAAVRIAETGRELEQFVGMLDKTELERSLVALAVIARMWIQFIATHTGTTVDQRLDAAIYAMQMTDDDESE